VQRVATSRTSSRSRRAPHPLRTALVLALVCLCAAPMLARGTSAASRQRARAQYVRAERMREELNGTPTAQRSRREYQRVMDAYRRVYYISPGSSKADMSVVAVAELLAEMGRAQKDEKSLRDAIAQYEFLRREYPQSRYRYTALFTIGQIYKEDLEETDKARDTFQEFLKLYPRHALAGDARDALNEMDQAARNKREHEPQPVAAAAQSEDPRFFPLVTGIRHWSTPDYTRVAIDLEQEVQYEAGRVANPDRIFFDLHNTRLSSILMGKSFEVSDGFLRRIRVAQFQRGMVRVVLDVDDVSDYSAFLLPNPYRLIIDIHGRHPETKLAQVTPPEGAPAGGATKPAKPPVETTTAAPPPQNNVTPPAAQQSDTAPTAGEQAESSRTEIDNLSGQVRATTEPTSGPTVQVIAPRDVPSKLANPETPTAKQPVAGAHAAKPNAAGEQTLIRALGLKIGRIVVDAGHGGHDTGTIGPGGLQEKDLVLDVALRLGRLLQTRMGAEVVYTRDDDTFVPLETRTAIANQQQGDLFISIHANSSEDASARGVETYYLNFTTSADALEVAARENAVSEASINELQDLVKKIALKEKVQESREFATDVQHALWTSLVVRDRTLRDRGVKKAPFIVLIGANMPSILAEIAFVSNPGDERRLQTPEYRQKIAEALYKGIARYASGLSGVKIATAQTPKPAQ